jgi:aspartate aminotransferase
MPLSRLATSVPQSPTLKLNEEARRLKEKGEPVINLTVGEPTNPTPQSAVQALNETLQRRAVKYSPAGGDLALKKAIIGYTEANYGRTVGPANIIVSSGAKNSLYTLFCTLLDPCDEVLIFAPYWVSYPEMVKMVGGVPVIVTPAGGGFYPALKDVEAHLTTRTKVVLVNSPNNPSGVVYGAGFIADVVGLCERRGLYLIMDDIYHRLVFDGKRAAPAFEFTDRDIESTAIIVINGVSKLYGMTGFRVGWTVASREIISVMGNLQGQSLTCVSSLLQAGAAGALSGPQDVLAGLLTSIEANRDLVMSELQQMEALTVTRPEGAFYVLPDFSRYQPSSLELCQFLLEKALVLTVPGKEFGAEGHLRLSFAGDGADVAEGLRRIRWALDPQAPREIELGGRPAVRNW